MVVKVRQPNVLLIGLVKSLICYDTKVFVSSAVRDGHSKFI